jgi:hypothetical protein
MFAVALAGGSVLFPSFFILWLKGVRGKKIENKLIIVTISGGFFFVVPIATIFFFALIIESHARQEVLSFIQSNTSYEMMIDGNKILDAAPYIQELRKIKIIAAHHSHTNLKIHMDIINSDKKITLILGQDSQNKNEFWIFYPKYRNTKLNEIGRLKTTIFENL